MSTPTGRALSTVDGQLDRSRALSPVERWYWIIDQISTANICARVRIEGEVSTEALIRARDALQARHALLRLAISDEGSDGMPRFVPTVNPIPLREVNLTRSEDERWQREADGYEIVDSVDWRSGPLARAVVIRQPGWIQDLMITVPHSIADGMTALALLRQLVELAAEPSLRELSKADGPVPPPVEALLPGSGRESSGTPPDELEPGGPEPGVHRLEPDRFVPYHLRRSRLLHRTIGGDILANLVLLCRRESVTLHGVLAAAVAGAVARDAGAPPSTRFAVGSPVTFRHELDRPVSEDDVGCFVSAVHSVVAYQPDDLWRMARSINRDIAERRSRGEQFTVFSQLAQQGPTGVADSGPFIQFIDEHGPFNFFVANIGRFEFPGALGPWHLSGAQFMGGISVVGYFGSSICTSHGQLRWNFIYVEGAVSRERAERLADDSVQTVLAVAAAS